MLSDFDIVFGIEIMNKEVSQEQKHNWEKKTRPKSLYYIYIHIIFSV